MAVKRGSIDVTSGSNGEHPLSLAQELIFILIAIITVIHAIATNDAVHRPRGHFHAVEGHRNSQTDEIHGVTSKLIFAEITIIIKVIVFSTEPEEAGTHVFGELTGDGDTSTVSGTAAEDGVIGDEAGQAEVLKTHTDLGVGLGDHPVNVAVTDLDDLAVGTEGSALIRSTPVLVAHFEEQDALQGFGSDDVDLGTQTLFRGEVILAGMLGKSLVTHLPRKRPVALGLDISSLRTSSSAEHEAGSKKQSHDALHLYSFLLK